MKIRAIRIGFVYLWLLTGAYFPNIHAMAAAPGITVAPALINVTLGPDDTTKTVEIGVTNNFSTRVDIGATLKAVDDSTGVLVPTIVIDAKTKQAVSIDKSVFSLDPGQSTSVKLMVQNNDNLKPGGTYLALVIKQLNGSSGSVGLQSAIGANIFITKQKGALHLLNLQSVNVHRLLFSEPNKVTLTFKNGGNVHDVPRGVVDVIGNSNNTLYKKGVINQESVTVFPGQSITLDVSLTAVQNRFWPSKQQIVVQYRVDGSDDIKTLEKSITYVPAYMLIGLPVFVAGSFFILMKLLRKRAHGITQLPPESSMATVKNSTRRIIVHDHTDGEKITVHRS